jgi:hypothetical protein
MSMHAHGYGRGGFMGAKAFWASLYTSGFLFGDRGMSWAREYMGIGLGRSRDGLQIVGY